MDKLISEITAAKPLYKDLRLNGMKYIAGARVCNVFFLYPKDADYPSGFEAEVTAIVEKILGMGLTYFCHFSKVSVIESFVKQSVLGTVKRDSGVELLPADITVTVAEGDKPNKVEFVLSELFFAHALHKGLDKKVAAELNDAFCADFSVVIKSDNKEVDLSGDILPPVKPLGLNIGDFGDKRVIVPNSIERLTGKEIDRPAVYIKDLSKHADAVICGSVRGWQQLSYKARDKEDPNKTYDRTYYKFVLEDFTGSVECVYFTNKSTPKSMEEMPDGQELIMGGTVKPPAVKNGKISFNARNISYCEIPEGLTEVKFRMPVPSDYRRVLPSPVVEMVQDSMFGSKKLPQSVVDNTYVVFDVETTGLSSVTDKITEIGAVKIKDGRIAEQFSTLINPQRKLTLENTLLTGITDDMLKNAPLFDEVAGDFYRFCDGAVLVAHNAKFDMGFLNSYADMTHYYFEHEVMDTWNIATKKVRLNDYKLSTLAKHYGVINDAAHRALSDAFTTAKVFLELCKE